MAKKSIAILLHCTQKTSFDFFFILCRNQQSTTTKIHFAHPPTVFSSCYYLSSSSSSKTFIHWMRVQCRFRYGKKCLSLSLSFALFFDVHSTNHRHTHTLPEFRVCLITTTTIITTCKSHPKKFIYMNSFKIQWFRW